MKKELSAWEKKFWAFWFRLRWALTFCAALNVWSLVDHYKRHDVTGWPLLPSAWVLPWLTLSCVGSCGSVAALWVFYLYKPRRAG